MPKEARTAARKSAFGKEGAAPKQEPAKKSAAAKKSPASKKKVWDYIKKSEQARDHRVIVD